MKILLTLLIVGLYIVSIKEASANYALSTTFNMLDTKAAVAFSSGADTNSDQALKVKSRKQAIAMVEAKFKAKVLSITASKVNGNPGYRAKLLGNNGIVFYVNIDAKTGRMRKA
jgi:uncharacterized membrane protein YkoI